MKQILRILAIVVAAFYITALGYQICHWKYKSNKPSQFPTRNEEAMQHEQEKAVPVCLPGIVGPCSCPPSDDPEKYLTCVQGKDGKVEFKVIYIGAYHHENESCFDDKSEVPCPSHDYIAELRVEAHRRGLKWKIFCSVVGDKQFAGWVIPNSDEWMEHIHSKEGFVRGATEQEAARNLIEAIGNYTGNKDVVKKCPPELSGN